MIKANNIDKGRNQEQFHSTILGLRAKNFDKGLPFLLLSDKLPEGQVYREFADGHIELQEVFYIGSTYKSEIVKNLTDAEASILRKEHGL